MSAPVPSPAPAAPVHDDSRLAASVRALDLAVDAPHGDGTLLDGWRRLVQQRLAELRAALAAEADGSEDGWLAARSGGLLRQRDLLVSRIGGLAAAALGSPDVDGLRRDLRRFVTDVGHHLQHGHDLAYDAVELELGGSE